MTTHTICYEALSSRTSGAASNNPGAAISYATGNIGWAIDADFSNPIPYRAIPPSAWQRNQGTLIVTASFRPSNVPSIGKVYGDTNIGSLDGATLDNGVNPFFGELGTGRQSPREQLNLDGALATAVAALADNDELSLWITQAQQAQNYFGLNHFIEFEEHPPDNLVEGSTRLAELLDTMVNAGNTYLLGMNSMGVQHIAQNCAFAGLAPEGAVYLRPEDFGVDGPDAIPLNRNQNQPMQFRAHPTVFYPAGKSQFIRSLVRQHVDNLPLDSPTSQPFAIQVINTAPVTSRWLVGCDGTYQIVHLPHPAGSDFRRPRDIWNHVWQPILSGGSALSLALNAPFNPVYSPNGGSITFRWHYCDYFRYLPDPTLGYEEQTGGPG